MNTETRPVTRAYNTMSAVQATQVALQDHYSLPKHKQQQETIASYHQAINHGLKAAEVYALLAIAEGVTQS